MDSSGLRLYDLVHWSQSFGKEWPVYPHAIEETIRNASIAYSERSCQHMIATLMLDGDLRYSCGDSSEFHVETGSVLVIPGNSDYSFSTTQLKHYHKLVLEVRGSLLQAVCRTLHLGQALHLHPPSTSEIETEMRELGALLKAGCENDIPLMLAKNYGLLSKFSLAAREIPEGSLRMLAMAKSKLENDLSGSRGIPVLAAELGVCQSKLTRLFRRELGISPLQYRTQCKMERARHFLTNTTLSIKEISLRLGYANQLYFSNDFKRNCGVSPRAFRRIHSG